MKLEYDEWVNHPLPLSLILPSPPLSPVQPASKVATTKPSLKKIFRLVFSRILLPLNYTNPSDFIYVFPLTGVRHQALANDPLNGKFHCEMHAIGRGKYL